MSTGGATVDGVDVGAIPSTYSTTSHNHTGIYIGDSTGTVDATNIGSNAVGGDELRDTCVSTTEILNGTIIDADMGNDGIDPDKITGDLVSNDRLDSNVVAAVVHKAERDAAGNIITDKYMESDGDTTAGAYHFTGPVVLDNATVTVHSATDFQIFGSATVRGGQYFMDNYQTILDTANMFIQNSDTMLRFYQGCDYSGADSFKVVHPSLGSFAVPFGVDSGAAYQGIIPTGANWRAPGGSGCGGNANRDFKWTYFALFNPLRSDAYENPTLYVTNDHTWKTYERPGAKDLADSSYTCYAPQPLLYIDSVGGTQNSDHLSDPRGFPNHLGQFAVIFRSKVGNNYRLWGTTSNDLVTFNQADTFPLTAASTTIDYLSPFFLWDKGNYYLFYGDAVADSVIWYRVTWPMSKRFDTVWAGTTVAVNLVTTAQPWPQAGMTPWHGAAKSLGRYAYALFCGCTKATPAGGAGASNLYLYTSADMGRNWTLRTAPILTYGKTYFDSSGIYEADFDFYHDGRKLSMDVLYSTKPWVGDWRICYSTIQLNPRVNYEFVTWAGTPPHDSEFTTVP